MRPAAASNSPSGRVTTRVMTRKSAPRLRARTSTETRVIALVIWLVCWAMKALGLPEKAAPIGFPSLSLIAT
jgi:hypothetical protein